MVAKSLHTLLHTIVDYAGLFPPANLAMEPAVAGYAGYRHSPDAWMLGRFVVPVARLEEFTDALRANQSTDPHAWRVAALVGDDTTGDARRIQAFNDESHGAQIDTAEMRAADEAAIRAVAQAMPRAIKCYVEIPVSSDPARLIAALGEQKLRAKIRTGGVTPEAFPTLDEVARFIRGCYTSNVGFKATAGLHHPLRSEHALTYAADSPCGVMHGFLNVFLTAALHYNGLNREDAAAVLGATSLDGFAFTDTAITYKDYVVSLAELTTVRRRFAVSFGSCSFREPVDELTELGLLS